MSEHDFDFANIILTKQDIKLIRKLNRKRTLLVRSDDCSYDYLLHHKVIVFNHSRDIDDGNIELMATQNTERYLSYLKATKTETIRNWITTIIAVAAFVLSIISIVLQFLKYI
ncbi:MAG: hypothetical protein K2H90_04900 [Oscillospiraceae bacterium]|nr:hypothetical protein [Oscillospiraceae bacterium]